MGEVGTVSDQQYYTMVAESHMDTAVPPLSCGRWMGSPVEEITVRHFQLLDLSAECFFFWCNYQIVTMVRWTKSGLVRLDRATRRVLRRGQMHQANPSLERLYLHRRKGGRGLVSVDATWEHTCGLGLGLGHCSLSSYYYLLCS